MSAVLAGYIYPDPVDWPLALKQIYATGATRYRVAKVLGVGESTVQGWEEGAEPRHATGQALIQLRSLLCAGPPPLRGDTTAKRFMPSRARA